MPFLEKVEVGKEVLYSTLKRQQRVQGGLILCLLVQGGTG